MKIKYLLILALCFAFAFTACGTTQNKKKEQKPDELEELWDEEFDGGEFGEEYSEDDLTGEVALNGDPNKADYIVISKESMTLNLYDTDGGLIFSFPVALGKNYGNKTEKGDLKTPEGEFTISQIQDSSTWTHDFNDGKGEIAGSYGNWFLRLATSPHTGIGIHGTHAPESIGTRATEGCIRLNNADLDKLKPLVRLGMKVTIETSFKDMEADGRAEENGVNKETIIDTSTGDTEEDDLFKDLDQNRDELNSIDPNKVAETDDYAVDHIIADGDTFGSLAKEYGTTSKRIQDLNPDVNPNRLQIGQKIRVKGDVPLTKSETQQADKKNDAVVENEDDVYHVIEDGDTFGSLAQVYGTTSKRIQELNPDVNPNRIQIGQKIRVKGNVSSVNAEPKQEEPKQAETVTDGEAVYHVIEDGDIFGNLAVKYGTTSKKIEELNPDLDPTKLQIGQKVRVK